MDIRYKDLIIYVIVYLALLVVKIAHRKGFLSDCYLYLLDRTRVGFILA